MFRLMFVIWSRFCTGDLYFNFLSNYFMKKSVILLFILSCGFIRLSAQIKIMLEKDVEKSISEAAMAKQKTVKNPYKIYSEDYIPVKENTGVRIAPRRTDVNSTEKKITYADITKQRQQRRREGKLSDLEEIQAQLRELQNLK